MAFRDAVLLELIKAALACVTLAFGWFVGQRIVANWDMRKKRQELDIAVAKEFHKLYGEFKEISRLWRAYMFSGERNRKVAFPDTVAFDLLKRASAAEGGVEAIIVKLATERALTRADINTLGLFRQAYQKLREAIRAGQELNWTYRTPEYHLYNELAARTACMIAEKHAERQRDIAKAEKNLRSITDIRSKDWESELDKRAQPASFQAHA